MKKLISSLSLQLRIGLIAFLNQILSIVYYGLIAKGIACDACSISAIIFFVTGLAEVITILTLVGIAFIGLFKHKNLKRFTHDLFVFLCVIALTYFLKKHGMINWYE
jgi:hypothetical protein